MFNDDNGIPHLICGCLYRSQVSKNDSYTAATRAYARRQVSEVDKTAEVRASVSLSVY